MAKHLQGPMINRVAKHLQGPMINSLLLIFDRIISNRLNTFDRKVIVVYENVFQKKT